MQILNISVQNRPARTVTSRPYALFHMEAIDTTFSFDDIVVNAPIEVFESMSASFDVSDMQYIKEVTYRTLTAPQVPMFSSMEHGDVHILEDVTYTNLNVDYEDLTSAVDIDDPVIRIALFTRTTEPLYVWSSFTLDDIEILEDNT